MALCSKPLSAQAEKESVLFLESFLKYKNDSETTATTSLFSILQVGGLSPRSKD